LLLAERFKIRLSPRAAEQSHEPHHCPSLFTAHVVSASFGEFASSQESLLEASIRSEQKELVG
jgi:hypothetical protein